MVKVLYKDRLTSARVAKTISSNVDIPREARTKAFDEMSAFPSLPRCLDWESV